MTTKKKSRITGYTRADLKKGEAVVVSQGKGYTVGKWKVYPFFQCLTCDYNTLVEPDMIEHQASHGKAG